MGRAYRKIRRIVLGLIRGRELVDIPLRDLRCVGEGIGIHAGEVGEEGEENDERCRGEVEEDAYIGSRS